MTLGPVVASVAGQRVVAGEQDILRHPNLGGIILFSRNYHNVSQLRTLCDEIRDIAGRPLLISVDQEGGRVQRFREGFSRLPAAAVFGTLYDREPEQALRYARESALTMAMELRRHGVDLSFAPVADIDYGMCAVIGNRAFHHDPEVVYQLCHAWQMGMRDAGMSCVAKHFPGHGGVAEDSHLETPVDTRSFDAIEHQDLEPFRRLVAEGMDAIMTAHVHFPAIDAKLPTFSARWIKDILRKELGFDGIVFSDDLIMAGAAVEGTLPDRAHASLNAGCDALLVCNDPQATREVLNALEVTAPERSLERLLARPVDRVIDSIEDRLAVFSPTLKSLVDMPAREMVS